MIEDLQQHALYCHAGDGDNRNFLAWLEETVAEAASASLSHRSMHAQIQQLCRALEQRYGFSAVLVRLITASSVASVVLGSARHGA